MAKYVKFYSYLKNGWYFKAVPSNENEDVFMAMAKRQIDGNFKTDSPVHEPAPNGLFFNFASSAELALESVEREVFSLKEEPKESRFRKWLKRFSR